MADDLGEKVRELEAQHLKRVAEAPRQPAPASGWLDDHDVTETQAEVDEQRAEAPRRRGLLSMHVPPGIPMPAVGEDVAAYLDRLDESDRARIEITPDPDLARVLAPRPTDQDPRALVLNSLGPDLDALHHLSQDELLAHRATRDERRTLSIDLAGENAGRLADAQVHASEVRLLEATIRVLEEETARLRAQLVEVGTTLGPALKLDTPWTPAEAVTAARLGVALIGELRSQLAFYRVRP